MPTPASWQTCVNEGVPSCKSQHFTTPCFTILDKMGTRDCLLCLPEVGWLRIEDNELYVGCKKLTVRGTYVCYEVAADQFRQGAQEGTFGLDCKVEQATASDDTEYRMTATSNLDANVKRKQRNRARQQKGFNRRRRTLDIDAHQACPQNVDTAHTVMAKDLDSKSMAASTQGTGEEPGTHIKTKSGLNRPILGRGWGPLERKLHYKVGSLFKVNLAHTSQKSNVCGHTGKRFGLSQAVFISGDRGFHANQNHNSAINILVPEGLPLRSRSARGTEAAARRGAFLSRTLTSSESRCGAGQASSRLVMCLVPNEERRHFVQKTRQTLQGINGQALPESVASRERSAD